MSHEIDRSHPTSQPINSMLRCPGLGGLHYAFSLEQKTGERHYVIFADDNQECQRLSQEYHKYQECQRLSEVDKCQY